MKLSVVIPVYNEEKTIIQIINQVEQVVLPNNIQKEIIIVDDCSTDKTRELLKSINKTPMKIIYHERNQGKGASLRDGFKETTGDFVIIQDADLEYDPNEYTKLLKPILENKADVVFGSRFLGGEAHRVLYYFHTLTNSFLTLCSNLFSDLKLTDMETGYKLFRKKVLDMIILEEERFGIEPELTAKIGQLARERKIRIYEVGISYFERTHSEGKKFKFKDAIRALWCIFSYNTSWFAHLVKYLVFGVPVALIYFITMWILGDLFGFASREQQNITILISLIIAYSAAFLFYSVFTWRYKYVSKHEFLWKFILFYLISSIIILPRLILYVFFADIEMYNLLSIILGIIIPIILNFIAYDKIVFKTSSMDSFEI